MKDFKDKVAFITGGGSGAGFGQAQIFSEAGCKVVIADVRQDNLDRAMEHFKRENADVHPIRLDVTDRAAYIAAADETERVYGTPPQILIQTAGVNAFGPAEASTYEDYDWIVGVNLGGVINGMVTFVPRMIRAGLGGHIVAVASLGGLGPCSTTAPYSCAKAAVINLMETYYEALKPYGIGVTCFCPGNMNTNIHEASLTRPENLRNSGYYESPEALEGYRKHNARGMDIRDVGRAILESIRQGIVISIPYENREDILRGEMRRMIDYCTPEGMARLKEQKPPTEDNEELRSLMEAAQLGWSKAKGDIDWVETDRRYTK
ncbi:MAG: SDR family NAD(P)-dependent oxidoreductase [Clostridiales Family XIII bacterium]|nr:SDR family NAD(P)-dependent oxidoreductase [Clostridiales Family XIII bacterium]